MERAPGSSAHRTTTQPNVSCGVVLVVGRGVDAARAEVNGPSGAQLRLSQRDRAHPASSRSSARRLRGPCGWALTECSCALQREPNGSTGQSTGPTAGRRANLPLPRAVSASRSRCRRRPAEQLHACEARRQTEWLQWTRPLPSGECLCGCALPTCPRCRQPRAVLSRPLPRQGMGTARFPAIRPPFRVGGIARSCDPDRRHYGDPDRMTSATEESACHAHLGADVGMMRPAFFGMK